MHGVATKDDNEETEAAETVLGASTKEESSASTGAPSGCHPSTVAPGVATAVVLPLLPSWLSFLIVRILVEHPSRIFKAFVVANEMTFFFVLGIYHIIDGVALRL